MKWLVIGIAGVAVIMFGLGWLSDGRRDADNGQAAAIFLYLPATALLALDAVILIGWGVFRLLFS